MLFSINRNAYIHYTPHAEDYLRWRERLTDEEFEAISEELHRCIDAEDVHTSSWIPGNNWIGTVYEPIYTKACDLDSTASGKCFGLFLWKVLQNHPKTWGFDRFEKNGVPISGLTYFSLENSPRRREK